MSHVQKTLEKSLIYLVFPNKLHLVFVEKSYFLNTTKLKNNKINKYLSGFIFKNSALLRFKVNLSSVGNVKNVQIFMKDKTYKRQDKRENICLKRLGNASIQPEYQKVTYISG